MEVSLQDSIHAHLTMVANELILLSGGYDDETYDERLAEGLPLTLQEYLDNALQIRVMVGIEGDYQSANILIQGEQLPWITLDTSLGWLIGEWGNEHEIWKLAPSVCNKVSALVYEKYESMNRGE